MKTIELRKTSARLKGMLAIVISSMAMLTSCNNEDNATTPTPEPLAGQLSGTWYCAYDATGTAIAEDGSNQKTIDRLSSHTGSVGIIYMDFAGMDESPDYTSTKLYNTVGMKLVDAVIKQNWKE